MTDNNTHAEKKQQLVHLNVGGVPFTILKETLTLGKHSKCMLAKLVDDHPETVKNGEYLFVDRNPKTFTWILEILRDGDYKGSVPEMSLEALEKELKFYKLPSISRLGVEVVKPRPLAMNPWSMLLLDIIEEIRRCGLLYMLPVEVFVYHEYKEGKLEEERKIFIVPPEDFNAKYVPDKSHRAFVSALFEGVKGNSETISPCKKLIPPNAKAEFWLVDFRDNVVLTLLNREACKHDMECTCHENVYNHSSVDQRWSVLCIQYQVRNAMRGDNSPQSLLF